MTVTKDEDMNHAVVFKFRDNNVALFWVSFTGCSRSCNICYMMMFLFELSMAIFNKVHYSFDFV